MAKSDATLKVTWRVNLADLFGKDFSDKDRLKQRIGEEFIARIQTRTQRGIDKKGRTFKGYSKAYKEETGKSNPPDLTLKGQLLKSLFVKDTTANTVTIGLKNKFARLKGENHIHGVTLPKRDFLGLPAVELKSVKREFEDDV